MCRSERSGPCCGTTLETAPWLAGLLIVNRAVTVSLPSSPTLQAWPLAFSAVIDSVGWVEALEQQRRRPVDERAHEHPGLRGAGEQRVDGDRVARTGVADLDEEAIAVQSQVSGECTATGVDGAQPAVA